MQTAATTALQPQGEIIRNMQPHSAQNMIMTTANKKTKKYASPPQSLPSKQQQQLAQQTQQQFQINKAFNVVSILKSPAPSVAQQQQAQFHHHQLSHHHQQQQQSYANVVNRSGSQQQQVQSAPTTVNLVGANMVAVNNCDLNTTPQTATAAIYGMTHRPLQNNTNNNSINSATIDSNGRYMAQVSGQDICKLNHNGSNSGGGDNGGGGVAGAGGNIVGVTNAHGVGGANSISIALGTSTGSAAFMHDKGGLVGINVGCVDSRKYDFKNNNLLASNSFQQSTAAEYVTTSNNNNGSARTNPQTAGGLFRGPHPPNSSQRGGGAGARHVHMPTIYQPAMHQVLPTYPQYTPRQPTFQAPQFQYTHAPITATYFPYPYLPTLQQPQAHQRSGVSVNPAVGVGNTMSVQTGPNGPIAGPGATQQQMPLPAGAVLTGAVQQGSNAAVLSVGGAGGGQVGVPPMVGVMSANVPGAQQTAEHSNRRRHQHRIPIIDPNTNKNILDDLDKNNSNSESDFQEQQVPVAQSDVPPGIPQQDSCLDLGNNGGSGSGVILINPEQRSNMPYSIEVNHITPQRDLIVSQTPVVSAMTDAPSVEILPTPQKPKSKKIPIITPKEDTLSGDQTNLKTAFKAPFDETNTATELTTTTITPEVVVAEASLGDTKHQQQQYSNIPSTPETTINATPIKTVVKATVASSLEQQFVNNEKLEEQEKENIPQKETIAAINRKDLASVAASTPSTTESVNELSGSLNNMQVTVADTHLLSAVENKEHEQQATDVSTQAPINLTNVKTDKVEEYTENQHVNSNGNISSKSETVLEDTHSAAVSVDEIDRIAVQHVANTVTKVQENSTVDPVKLSDPTSDELSTAPTTVSTNDAAVSVTSEEVTESKQQDTSNSAGEKPVRPAILQSLISYNEGQWSPDNPTGKKQYNREQLLQLREAKASRVQPEVSNVSILPQPNLMPSFMRSNNKRVQSMVGSIGGNRGGGDGVGGVAGNYMSKQASMSGVQGRNSMKGGGGGGGGGMIHVNLSLNQDVKLNENENAWRPSVLVKADNVGDPEVKAKLEKDELVRRVRGILNKLTPEKFDTLVEEIIKLKIDTPDKMEEVMVLVFEKAIDEPNFSVSYARLCHRLINEVKARDERMESGTKSNLAHFRNALLDKTEREFTQNVSQSTAKEKKLQPIVDKIKKCTDPNEKAELEAFLEEEERKIRRRSGGTVRFIGELFKISMLTGKIIWSCIDTLLNPQSEDMLECLCKLLTTVGAKFEQTAINSKEPVRYYSLEKPIAKMQSIASKSEKDGAKVSSRVRFMLQDVIDLRKNKWQSTRNEAPKTMGQIEKEAKNEQLSAQYLNYSGSVSNSGTNGPQVSSGSGNKRDDRSGGGRYGDNRSGYGGSHSQRGDTGSLRRQQQGGNGSGSGGNNNNNNNHSNGNNDDNTWHVQTSKGSRSLAVDTNKLEGLLHQNLDTKKMGGVSQFIWNNNASRQSSTPTTTPSNSFAALSSLLDKSSSNDRNDRDRSGPRNKGSYNKGSMERDRYGGGLHSRTGSSQGSRENSSSRMGGQNVRGMMNSSSMQKSASHSKYTQQQMPSSRMAGKSGMPSSSSGGLYRNNDQQHQSNMSSQLMNHNSSKTSAAAGTSAPPAAVFVEPNDNDLKLIKSVISEMLELAVVSKGVTPTAVLCIKRVPEVQRCGFLYYILTEYLHLAEVGKVYRRYLAIIVANLMQQNHLSVEHFNLAYKEFCKFANDLIVDIPELWQYIFQFTGPLIVKKIISISDLWNKQLKDNSPSHMGKKFLKTYLTYCTREIGPNFTRSMWKKFNMKWSDFVPDEDVIDFIESNNLEYIEYDAKAPVIEVREDYEKHIKNVIEHIEHLLMEGSNADSIIDYINGNIVDINKYFIRSLTETLCNFATSYKDCSYKLNTELFQKVCIPVLQRYIDSHEDRELECLYSMQLLVHSLEHPRGLLSELFGELYDGDVIPQDSFIKWRDSKDQSAGKGVAVKGLNPFFNHVLSGETSDENN